MTDQDYDDQLVRVLAERDEWQRMQAASQAEIDALKAKNQRLVQLRAEEAGITGDRIRSLESSLGQQARLAASL